MSDRNLRREADKEVTKRIQEFLSLFSRNMNIQKGTAIRLMQAEKKGERFLIYEWTAQYAVLKGLALTKEMGMNPAQVEFGDALAEKLCKSICDQMKEVHRNALTGN